MAPQISLADAVLALTAAALLYAAIIDFKRYTINNALIFILAALFLAFTAVTGRWSALPWHIAMAGIVFAALLYFYARSWMGGGDVKMLTVAFLWIGSEGALLFAMLLCSFSSIHGLAAKLNWLPSRTSANDARMRIALAPSVAAALIGTLLLLHCQDRI